MMPTKTQPAAPGADEPETELTPTRSAAPTPLAWSADDDDDETLLYPETGERWTPEDGRGHSWGTVAIFVALMAVVIAGAGAIIWTVRLDHQDAAPAPATQAAPASSAPVAPIPSGPDDKIVPSAAPAPPPPPVAAPPPVTTEAPAPTTVYVPAPAPAPVMPHRSAADEGFIAALREDGIIVTDPAEIIAGGHRACQLIAAGHTAHDVMRQAIAENPTLTPENASILIGAAIGAYCPQYTGR